MYRAVMCDRILANVQTTLNAKLSAGYSSASQKSRILTESWVDEEAFCPSCGSTIKRFANNRPVADFFCPDCGEQYELKSKKNVFGNSVADGAYATMLERLESNTNPSFFLLTYDPDAFEVSNFCVIPKHFFVPQIIEKRKPLSPTARRAGWVGCNISLRNIPRTGRIYYIRNRQVEPKEKVLENWKKTLFLGQEKAMTSRGWILDVMTCIDRLGKKEFDLTEMYSFEKILEERYPSNRHIRDKIRQQLQLLRDRGYLEFTGRGRYRVTT